MLWILVIGCGLCVWTTLSLMGSERSRRMGEIVHEVRREARSAKPSETAKTAGNKAIR
jgi:hypothetical protein